MYTGFMQFNMNFPMTLGFNLGTQCFSSLFSSCFNNYSYQANPFAFSNAFTMPNYFNTGGFDTFAYSSGNMFNNFGFSFNNFSMMPWNITPSLNMGFPNFGFYPNFSSSAPVTPTKPAKKTKQGNLK